MVIEIIKQHDSYDPETLGPPQITSIVLVKRVSQRAAEKDLVELVEVLYGPKMKTNSWHSVAEDLFEGHEAIKKIFSYEYK